MPKDELDLDLDLSELGTSRNVIASSSEPRPKSKAQRDKEEFDQAKIESSIHISRGFLEFKINSVVPDQKAHIILYCGSGGRSAFAAESLERMGYSNVSSMAGGIKAWYESGKPVK